MFDECHNAAGHEPRRTDGLACARDFNHLDNSATRRDLDPTPRARRDDLVGTRTVVCRHHDLDAVTLHVLSLVRSAPEQHVCTIRHRARPRRSILIDCIRKQVRGRIDQIPARPEPPNSANTPVASDTGTTRGTQDKVATAFTSSQTEREHESTTLALNNTLCNLDASPRRRPGQQDEAM
jgi:hypothetical protein